jgi:hypothetical protein
MKEYKTLYKQYIPRKLGSISKLDLCERDINDLAQENWTVKFVNLLSFEYAKEDPRIIFYALLEREKK